MFPWASFPHRPVCVTIIKLAASVSGIIDLMVAIVGMKQPGLQLRLVDVTHGRLK